MLYPFRLDMDAEQAAVFDTPAPALQGGSSVQRRGAERLALEEFQTVLEGPCSHGPAVTEVERHYRLQR